MTEDLLPALTARATEAAHARDPACSCAAAATLAHRDDATVVRHAAAVAKAHAPGTDPAELTLRLAVAARLPGVLLPPLAPAPAALHGRPVTYWPYGMPVDPDDPDAAPWEEAGVLLARLHRAPLPETVPSMRGPEKAARAVAPCTTPPRVTPPPARCWTPGRTSRRGPAARRPRRGPHASATATSTSGS
ncbi:hypothetical protein STENM223S_02651 [Streptomyces tendae]